MDTNFARNFDRDRNFASYWKNDSVGASWWVLNVAAAAQASSDMLTLLQDLFNRPLTAANEEIIKQELPTYEEDIITMGMILSTKLGAINDELLKKLNWKLPAKLPPPVVTGTIRTEPADEMASATLRESSGQIVPLRKMLKLEAGPKKYTLVCPNDPLESFAGDLSAFEGAYQVSVRGWPDSTGRIYVLETAPVMNLPDYQVADFAQGRLYDNGVVNNPVVLRVNAMQQITIEDQVMQEELRPFIGTGLILFGKRSVDNATGKVSLKDVYKHYWVLCRLTDPKDDANNLPQAPLPQIQGNTCLCIGGTPPWNWKGPNIRTHLLTPIHTIGLIRTTERRLVFGKILLKLPDDIENPLPDVQRAMQVITATERDIDNEAVWGTRLGPVSKVHVDLSAISYLTSAFTLVRNITVTQQ